MVKVPTDERRAVFMAALARAEAEVRDAEKRVAAFTLALERLDTEEAECTKTTTTSP